MEPQTSPRHVRSFVQLMATWCPFFAQLHGIRPCVFTAWYLAKKLRKTICRFLDFFICFFTSRALPCTLPPAQPPEPQRSVSSTPRLSWAPPPYVVARRCLHPERQPPAAVLYSFPFFQWSWACSAHCLMCENCCFIVWFSCLIPSLESITSSKFRNEVPSCLILIPPYWLYLGC